VGGAAQGRRRAAATVVGTAATVDGASTTGASVVAGVTGTGVVAAGGFAEAVVMNGNWPPMRAT
jgi:hypothetical protein